jgi:hypothetical protein
MAWYRGPRDSSRSSLQAHVVNNFNFNLLFATFNVYVTLTQRLGGGLRRVASTITSTSVSSIIKNGIMVFVVWCPYRYYEFKCTIILLYIYGSKMYLFTTIPGETGRYLWALPIVPFQDS